MTRHAISLAQDVEAAMAWWHTAGVDCAFVDDATGWLAVAPMSSTLAEVDRGGRSASVSTSSPGKPARGIAQPAASPPRSAALPIPLRHDLLGDSPPGDLAAFRHWWMEAPDLDTARGFPRVPPRGERGAKLMVLVPQPEAGDSERLLSGQQGRLLANILAAMSLDENAVYLAAALPSHTPMADLPALAAGGMDAVTAHHIGLVAPERVLAFGTGLAPMLGAPDRPLREINHNGRRVPATLSETLETLMEMPRLKARFWRRWMEWSATC